MIELYKHNKITYDKAVKVLEASGRVAIIQATGTGKSFITMKLFQDYFPAYKKLYIVPKHSIAESIQMYDDWSNDNVVFCTYQSLQNTEDSILHAYTSVFQVILCDEFHHSGAPKWHRAIKVLSDNAKYFIGLSATNVRYLDNNRDMAKELFDTNVVHGPSLSDAIQTGILPRFQYISLLHDVHEFVEAYSGKVSKYDSMSRSKLERMRLSEDGSYELGVRLRKYIRPDNKKWIVFCNTIESMQDIDIDIRNWFATDEISIYKLHSHLPKSRLKTILSEFEQNKGLSVIACVDMLNEGVHVSGVTGLIMLRKTNSLTVFLQQLGRALSASNKDTTPQIIDVMENYSNMKTMITTCRDLQSFPDTYSSQSGKEMFIVDDILMQAEDIVKSISEFQEPREWQSWEDQIIIDNYPLNGPKMFYMIPGITKKQCSDRAKELGILFRRTWTENEDLILKRFYPVEGKQVYKRLNGRTKEACASRASTLRLRYFGKWNVDCDLILMTFYGIEGDECFKRLPNFTEEECLKNLKKLGIPRHI